MRLKLKNIKGLNYIVGYGFFAEETYPDYEWKNVPEKITDEYNQPLYYFNGKEILYKPIEYTDEQTEELRNKWVRIEIEKRFPIDKQLGLIMDYAQGKKISEYKELEAFRQDIKSKSKLIDFQIKETVDGL